MRHFGPLVICASLVWIALGAVPIWLNVMVADAVMHKRPTPPSAEALLLARCNFDRSSVAVFVPLVLAWSIRTWSLRREVPWVRLLRGTLETILLVFAVWLTWAAFPIAYPLEQLILGPCGPLR